MLFRSLAHQGQEICFASNTDTLTIVDVTNKAAPVMISRTGYPGVGYTHQGWLTADQSHFLIDDELDEMNLGHPTWTYIWNLTDLDAPVLLGHYTGPTMATDHNQYIHQGYSYQADYRAGLRILEVEGGHAGAGRNRRRGRLGGAVGVGVEGAQGRAAGERHAGGRRQVRGVAELVF